MKGIERISITDQVARNIKDEIVSGRYRTGDKLPTERELCEQFQVGRSTVREALRVLQALDLIELKQGRGAFVTSIADETTERSERWLAQNADELLDFMEVRDSIEALGVRLAVERASRGDIRRIEDVQSAFEGAVKADSQIDCTSLDEAFHSAIMEATHNKLLIALNEDLSTALRPYRLRSFGVTGYPQHAVAPHREVLQNIKRRDADNAERAMRRHLQISKDDILHAANFEIAGEEQASRDS